MYLNILKKDLKRKRTMNFILLVFVILSVTFTAAGLNTILSVTTALDDYFTMANVSDYTIVTRYAGSGDGVILQTLDGLDYVRNYQSEKMLYLTDSGINFDDKDPNINNSGMVMALETSVHKLFDKDDKPLEISDGEIWIKRGVMEDNNLSEGGKITLSFGNVAKTFTIRGYHKDAFFGSAMMGMARYVISQNDFDYFFANVDTANLGGSIIHVNVENSSDLTKLEQAIGDIDANVVFSGGKSLITMTYFMDISIAGILVLLSIFLLLIAFVVLRFTINFTLSEEFREIGIMKAIGITHAKIRGLYLVKYVAIAIVGSVLGLALSVPFGDVFISQIRHNIIVKNDGSLLINLISAVLIVGIVVLFSYSCTGRLKKFTPVDAIRNGSTGERFRGKGLFSLAKSRLSPVTFMAGNDIASSLPRYLVMIVIFTLGFSLLLVMLNTVNTLTSDKIVPWFGLSKSDLFMTGFDNYEDYMVSDGRTKVYKTIEEIEDRVAENGFESKAAIEIMFKLSISRDGKTCKSIAAQGTGTKALDYEYIEGYAPVNVGEVAITPLISEKIGAGIGDTVNILIQGEQKPFLITALYQSLSNMGEGIRFNEDETLDYAQTMGLFLWQLSFADSPSRDEIAKRIEILEKAFPNNEFMYPEEYTDSLMGGVSDILNGVNMVILAVVLMINILVAVLMEKSYITKERGEIGMLKAIGFSNGAILRWQVLRMGFVMVISILLAAALQYPVFKIGSEPIFHMMGATSVSPEINPLENYLLYPLILLAATVVSSYIAALGVYKISPAETSNIE